MATLRDVRNKIRAVEKTRQITKAMNMVAAAKLRSTQIKLERFDPYASKFGDVLGHLAERIEHDMHPLLNRREEVNRVDLLLFTGDRGLCGSFNSNLINAAEKWIRGLSEKGATCNLSLVGKKGRDYFKKTTVNVLESYTGIYGTVDIAFINKLAQRLADRFLKDETDEVHILYSRFGSVASLVPTFLKLIPIAPPQGKESDGEGEGAGYMCEPSVEELLIELLPKYLSVQILDAFLQNETSEHAARMASMDNATRNCDDLTQQLTLAYNKARQAAITTELVDIVGGAEALK